MKRIFDFSLALSGIILSLPLWFLFAFLIWLEDRSALFFTQDRVGLDGRTFKIIKFRTMNSKNGKISKFTRFLRKTALDELPQLINILKSDMSFVGPRPLIPEELSSSPEVKIRFKIKPGLTGLAQIFLPKDATWQEKLKYDIWYADNQGFWLDIKLILKSFRISLSRKWDTVNNKGFNQQV